MAKRGRKPARADGCYVTKDGYLAKWDPAERKHKLEHRRIWEEAHGPIPPGHIVHHKNRKKQDNRLDNLALVTPQEHTNEHQDQRLIDGRWFKFCARCGVYAPIDSDWNVVAYAHKPCQKTIAAARRKRLRAKAKSLALSPAPRNEVNTP